MSSTTKYSFSDRFRYQFDNYMAKGTVALISGLALLSLFVIFLAALIVMIFRILPEGMDPQSMSFSEAMWAALMRTMDAGAVGADVGWGFRILMLIVTLGGIFIFSALIGVLTSGMESKMESLRKGRSRVIEKNHTIVLGWSGHIFSIIQELVIANKNQKDSCIVILADKDKVEMEDEIKEKINLTKETRIVCRCGNPINIIDLDLVSLNESRSIIVLSTESADADIYTIKTILAITNHPQRRKNPYHIVAEIKDAKNMEAGRLVGRDEAQLILADDLISRITAQTCRQSGLSVIYNELLDFNGDEVYLKEEPTLVGKRFSELLFLYETSAVMGILQANGKALLNPPMETLLQKGDKLIVISADDHTITLSGKTDYRLQTDAISQVVSTTAEQPEKTLILGWNGRGDRIVRELDHYVAQGSQLLVVADAQQAISDTFANLNNITAHFQEGQITSRALLMQLDLPTFDQIIVLSYSDQMEMQEADACTLVTLLQLRDIAEKTGKNFSIVSEMLDIRNRELAEITKADDFIVSNRLISLMMSQISENKTLSSVFTDLFDPNGAELYLKPAHHYIQIGKPINFYTIVEAAKRRGETALGYRLGSQENDVTNSYGVYLNPNKSKTFTFTEQDSIIILADN